MYGCLENENKILEIMQKGTRVYSLSKYGLYFYLYSTRTKGSCFIVMWLLYIDQNVIMKIRCKTQLLSWKGRGRGRYPEAISFFKIYDIKIIYKYYCNITLLASALILYTTTCSIVGVLNSLVMYVLSLPTYIKVVQPKNPNKQIISYRLNKFLDHEDWVNVTNGHS